VLLEVYHSDLAHMFFIAAPVAVFAPAVARIALVKPDKARNVENMILAAAQRGALQSKVRQGAFTMFYAHSVPAACLCQLRS